MDAPIKLLVVDDHEDVRFLVRMIVGDHPEVIEVVGEAAGALEAVEKLATCAPDAVVLDARMPIHDGFEAAGMLLERAPDLVIVLLTAFVDEEICKKARSAGIREVLGKDEFDAIPETVSRLLGRPGPPAAAA